MWAWLAVPHLYRTSREGRILLPTQNLREQQADRLRAAAGPPRMASARPPGGPVDQEPTRESLEPRGVLIGGFVTSRVRQAFASKKFFGKDSASFGARE